MLRSKGTKCEKVSRDQVVTDVKETDPSKQFAVVQKPEAGTLIHATHLRGEKPMTNAASYQRQGQISATGDCVFASPI